MMSHTLEVWDICLKQARVLRSLICCFIVFSLLTSCGNSSAPIRTVAAIDSAQIKVANTYNAHVVDNAVSLLRNGDIVLRTGIGPDSYMLSQLNKKDKTYSHCGIVMIENGYPFVYHSIGGEDNPDERLRRDSASFFFSPVHNLGLGIVRYDFSRQIFDSLNAIVAHYYKLRPRFDMKFDLATDDQLYCTEFVYKSLIKATRDTAYLHTSDNMGHAYVAVDNLFINPHARFIWKMRFK